MGLNVYLSGEIHTDWRDQITEGAASLDIAFSGPVTDHGASDDCGVHILGAEQNKFWHDNKGANINAIRTRNGIAADVVVVRFGDKYKQWNAASMPVMRRRSESRHHHARAGPPACPQRGRRRGACRD